MANDRPLDPPDTVSPPPASAQPAINVTHLPSPLRLLLRALLSARKPARAQPLPSLAFERRNVLLDANDIARYARLCGFADSHGVPPTWPHLLAFPLHMLLMTDRAFPFAMLGMVHLANRIRLHAPLAAGDRLDFDVRCGTLYAHDKGQVFAVLTTARRDGDVVWSGESLYLRTGVHDALGAPYRAELRTNSSLVQTATWQVPGDLGRQYARVSGDYNPIHLWPVTARLFGFPRPIIHGMWSFARALAAVLPADARHLDLLVEFKTPLLLPGEATFWCDSHSRAFELRDAAGAVPHLRGRWQAAPSASPSINTFATDRS
ncbi:MaoC/PaaZ C-terminal domain-containing protein [Pandoraea bronchicola]|uniref:MaoC domain-containing protein dehydratase n=1 Tax=Pandoraea bronchicola TaxID=2508287 RepID=A0A5E5BP75_9BURK|nr:MaoC/PaaZ C-terminal domain-containing protein [Pandoraea bronchicola]VVE87168.1 MaoC domain-containing protein dehydratase [Pandoraea bronchicola]